MFGDNAPDKVSIDIHGGGPSGVKRALEAARDVLHGVDPDANDDARPIRVWVRVDGLCQVKGDDFAELSSGEYPLRAVGRKYVEVEFDADYEHGGWHKVHADGGDGPGEGVVGIAAEEVKPFFEPGPDEHPVM